jgi:beta-galactosidase/beta-glucuronidase
MESDTAGASGSVSVPLLLHDPPLWSLGHPELETARVELLGPSGPVDSLEERFGVRSIEAKGRQVPLNGRPVRVRGVNRYDEFPGRGPVVDEETIREDLLAVKALGAIQALWRAEMERAAP